MNRWAYTRPEGFRDDSPETAAQVHFIESTVLDLCRRRGFLQVMVPTLEYADLYHPARIGTALFHQLMVARVAEAREFPSHPADHPGVGCGQGGRAIHEVVLRPDMTAPVARAFVSRLLERGIPTERPVRMSYAGQVFRDQAPDFDRLKEFRQVGVESVGARGFAVDLEVVLLAWDAAVRLEVPGARLCVSHAALTPALVQALGITRPDARNAVVAGLQQLRTLLRRTRVSGTPLRSVVQEQMVGLRARSIPVPEWAGRLDELDDETVRSRVVAHLADRLQAQWVGTWGVPTDRARRLVTLASLESPAQEFRAALTGLAVVDDRVAATLEILTGVAAELEARRASVPVLAAVSSGAPGYYTGMTFELHSMTPEHGAVRICGGGRYDRLHRWIYDRAVATAGRGSVGSLPPLPDDLFCAIGFAFGVERVRRVLPQRSNETSLPNLVRVQAENGAQDLDALALSERLREVIRAPVIWYPAIGEGTPGAGRKRLVREAGARISSGAVAGPGDGARAAPGGGVDVVVLGSGMLRVTDRATGRVWQVAGEDAAGVFFQELLATDRNEGKE